VDRLIGELARLPGIGRRSAERLALHLMKTKTEEALALAKAIGDVKTSVRHCLVCYNLTDAAGEKAAPLCAICASPERERHKVLVVEQPRDLLALEATGLWRGAYHVLLGRVSPLEGIGPGDLTIPALLERVDHPESLPEMAGRARVSEVLLGLNPTLESDGTGLYLAEQLQARGVKVTRLARGLPAGSTLEFASRAVLADALEGRQAM
jgi:recombination protein RecR